MNSHNSDKQNDSTISGQEGRDERADENSKENYEKLNEGLNEGRNEENAKMNDENDREFDETGAAEAERPEVRDEGPELTDLLRQASGQLRRKFFAAAKAGEFGDRGQVIREQVDAVVDEALSEEELESLTDSLGKIVDALGENAEDASAGGRGDEWDGRREFAGRRGSAARREFARRLGGYGRSASGQEYGFDPRGVRSPWRERNLRRERDPRAGWDSRREWDEGIVDEGRFDHRRSHEDCRPEAHGADHRARSHRAGGRRSGMGRMVGAAFEHGFAAGYKRGARS